MSPPTSSTPAPVTWACHARWLPFINICNQSMSWKWYVPTATYWRLSALKMWLCDWGSIQLDAVCELTAQCLRMSGTPPTCPTKRESCSMGPWIESHPHLLNPPRPLMSRGHKEPSQLWGAHSYPERLATTVSGQAHGRGGNSHHMVNKLELLMLIVKAFPQFGMQKFSAQVEKHKFEIYPHLDACGSTLAGWTWSKIKLKLLL